MLEKHRNKKGLLVAHYAESKRGIYKPKAKFGETFALGCCISFCGSLNSDIINVNDKLKKLNQTEIGHDRLVCSFFSYFGKVEIIKENLIYHRLHNSNVSDKKERSGLKISAYEKIKQRYIYYNVLSSYKMTAKLFLIGNIYRVLFSAIKKNN